MDRWSEIHTALLVARLGTVSAAAQALGVHRATVNRHIDALEREFGTVLFQRHPRGYTPTDAGRDLLETAGRAAEMFEGLAGRARGRGGGLSGELIITALAGVTPLLMPAFARLRERHPEIVLKYVTGAELLRLEYGEAHVAVRAGPKPQDPDHIVLPFRSVRFGLYAANAYIERYGWPGEESEFSGHKFVGQIGSGDRLPFSDWLGRHVSENAYAFRADAPNIRLEAVRAGMGLGFFSEHDVAGDPGIVEIIPPRDEWSSNLWILTHVDLHRTARVQAVLEFLRPRSRASSDQAP